MVSNYDLGWIYTEGVDMISVGERSLFNMKDELEIEPRLYTDPKWVRFRISPDAVPGLIEALKRAQEAR